MSRRIPKTIAGRIIQKTTKLKKPERSEVQLCGTRAGPNKMVSAAERMNFNLSLRNQVHDAPEILMHICLFPEKSHDWSNVRIREERIQLASELGNPQT